MLMSLWALYANADMKEDYSYKDTTNPYIAENVVYESEDKIDYELKKDNDNSNFTCDGREYCSQMHSCEEATYFINHCPNTKMDGNHDGVPCERQWCNK